MIVECKECHTAFNLRDPTEIMQNSTQQEHIKQFGHFIQPVAIQDYDEDREQHKKLEKLLNSKPGGK